MIGTIFFTHLHPDHDLGLVDVMANDYFHLDLASDARKINIYGPPQTSELVEAAFHYISIPFKVFAAEKPGFQLGRPNHGRTSPFVAHESLVRELFTATKQFRSRPPRIRITRSFRRSSARISGHIRTVFRRPMAWWYSPEHRPQ